MNITNKHNYPDYIYRSICANWYKKINKENHFSATEILKSHKQYWIEKKYIDSIEIDMINLLWAWDGSAKHEALAKGENENSLTELRLKHEIKIDGITYTLTGQLDHYENNIIYDLKNVSVNDWFYKSSYKKYEEQLNIYAYLLRQNNFEVKEIKILFNFKDWSATKSSLDDNYPFKLETVTMKLWSIEDQKDFIEKKILDIIYYRDINLDLIPECSMEDRWQKDDTFAVMKKNNKRASKVCETEIEAKEYIENQTKKEDYEIERREGIPNRCLGKIIKDKEIIYCHCREHCNFFQKIKNNA